MEEHADELAVLVAREVGKPVRSARTEALRCADTMRLSAIEARRIAPEGVPMEGSAAGAGKLGFVIRVPYGVVGAISPFNFPLNLVAHKLGPALAAGNAVVLKPAEQAPLSGLRLAEILLEAGVPPGWVNVVPGLGEDAGAALVDHERARAITFTGSAAVGLAIQARVPRKKVSLALGSTAPLIVCEDGDWRAAADAAIRHAFSFAGQACVSVQRILVHRSLLPRFRERLVAGVSDLVVGDPLDERTDVGPLIPGRAGAGEELDRRGDRSGRRAARAASSSTMAVASRPRSSRRRPQRARSGARRCSDR